MRGQKLDALFADLNLTAKRSGGTTPFIQTVVRFGPRPGEYTLMNRQVNGWGQRGYTYGSLWELCRDWRIRFTGVGFDAHSVFFRVEPRKD